MNWIKCSEKLPDKNGSYLAVLECHDQTIDCRSILIIKFASDMSKVDDEDSLGCVTTLGHDGPGWYNTYYDSEYGETEYNDLMTRVTYWMPLPALPDN